MTYKHPASCILFVAFAFSCHGADRTIQQTVDTTTARVQPAAIGVFRGESVSYVVTPLRGTRAITVSSNATATWTVTTQTNVLRAVLELAGTLTTNGVCMFYAAVSNTTMAAGCYDSFVRIQDGATLVTASRTTLNVYKSPYAESISVVPYSFAEPLWVAASNRVVYGNQMGSGATWSGSQWTFAGGSSTDLSFTNNYSQTNHLHTGVYQPAGTYVTAESDPVWQAQSSTVWGAISGKQATGDYATVTALGGYVATGAVGTAAYASSNHFATSNQGALADGAWQNPASATNLLWTSDGKGVTITGCVGAVGTLVIPEMLDGLPVVAIGSNAFSFTYQTGVLVIPNSVTSIGNYAFFDNSLSGELTIPNSVITIGEGAFGRNSFTSNLVIPDSVVTIGKGAFDECYGITGNLTIGKSVKSIHTLAGPQNITGSVVINAQTPPETPLDYGSWFSGWGEGVTNVIVGSTATGWGDTFGGLPVVRLPLYGSGTNLTGVLKPGDNAVLRTNEVPGFGGTTNIIIYWGVP